ACVSSLADCTSSFFFSSFFSNVTAITAIYTLSLHDALPISRRHALHGGDGVCLADLPRRAAVAVGRGVVRRRRPAEPGRGVPRRSEEHTSELQSRFDLVCRLLLEKKKKILYDIKYTLK